MISYKFNYNIATNYNYRKLKIYMCFLFDCLFKNWRKRMMLEMNSKIVYIVNYWFEILIKEIEILIIIRKASSMRVIRRL